MLEENRTEMAKKKALRSTSNINVIEVQQDSEWFSGTKDIQGKDFFYTSLSFI